MVTSGTWSLQPGELIDGRFEIRAPLGAGGMGEVFEAFDRERNYAVALKTMRVREPDSLALFKNEFRAMEGIRHPNLVGLGELFEVGGRLYFTMELVRGVPLLKWLRGGAPSALVPSPKLEDPLGATLDLEAELPPVTTPWSSFGSDCDEGRLRACLAQLAHGLLAIHGAGKVHRDVKPSNVLVTPEGRLVLLDFGLLRDVETLPVDGSERLGTLQYMSPEQATGQRLGQASDWYSVGVTLYQALTGTFPFQGSAAAVLELKSQRAPPPPEARTAGVPADLSALCMALLSLDPSARPSGQGVLSLLGVPAVRTQPAQAGFVGRELELASLGQAFDDAERGGPVTVVVVGDAGVGKSALLLECGRRLRAQAPSVVLLSGRCFERESVPFKALDGVVDALAAHLRGLNEAARAALLPEDAELLAQAFPVLRPFIRPALVPAVEPQERRRRLFLALRECLRRLSAQQRLVLIIDDLHRTDLDSMALLREVLRGPDGPALLLLCSARAEAPERHHLRELAGDVRHLELGGLSSDETQTLVSALSAQRGEDAVDLLALARETGGHPLFIRELVGHLRGRAGGPWRTRLDDVLWERVGSLDVVSRTVMELLAVAGAPVPLDCLAAAAGTARVDFDARVAELRAAQLLLSSGLGRRDTVEAYHDRIVTSVRARLEAPRRSECHRRLALALEAHGVRVDAETLALHFGEAGYDDKAASYAEQAARAAAEALAFDRAARLFAMALERGARTAEARWRLEVARGDALANAGRGALAAEAYRAALADAPPAEAQSLEHKRADQLLVSGLVSEGISVLRRVLPPLGMKMPSTARGSLLALLVNRVRLWFTGLDFRERPRRETPAHTLLKIDVAWSVASKLSTADVVRSAYFQTQNLLMALRAGDTFRVCRALVAEAAYSAVAGPINARRSQRLLEVTAALSARLGDPYSLAMTEGARAWVSFLEARWLDASDAFDRSEALLRKCTNVVWELDTARSFSLFAHVMRGRLGEVAVRLTRCLPEAEERGDLHFETHLKAGLSTFHWLARGRPDEARELAREVVGRWSTDTYQFPHAYLLWSESLIDLYRGDAAAAHRRLSAQWSAISRTHLTINLAFRTFTLAIRGECAAQAGRWDTVLGCVRTLRRLRSPEAAAHGVALEAQLARHQQNDERARLAWEAAMAQYRSLAMELHTARAARELGALLGGDEGAALTLSGFEAMRGQQVVEVDAFTRTLA